MNKRHFKKIIAFSFIILFIASIFLFIIGLLHDCHNEACLICSFISLGFIIIGILGLLLISFTISYQIILYIKNSKYKTKYYIIHESINKILNNSIIIKNNYINYHLNLRI